MHGTIRSKEKQRSESRFKSYQIVMLVAYLPVTDSVDVKREAADQLLGI